MYFQGVVERSERMSQSVLISGPVGAGKTILAKKLGSSLEKKAACYGNRVKFFHVNCRIDRSLQAILTKGLHLLGHGYPSRGFSFEELLQSFFEALDRRQDTPGHRLRRGRLARRRGPLVARTP